MTDTQTSLPVPTIRPVVNRHPARTLSTADRVHLTPDYVRGENAPIRDVADTCFRPFERVRLCGLQPCSLPGMMRGSGPSVDFIGVERLLKCTAFEFVDNSVTVRYTAFDIIDPATRQPVGSVHYGISDIGTPIVLLESGGVIIDANDTALIWWEDDVHYMVDLLTEREHTLVNVLMHICRSPIRRWS